jgi:hypothetical protein
MINQDQRKPPRLKRYTVASAGKGLIGCTNPVDDETDVVPLNQPGIQSLPKTGEEVLLSGSERDPIALGVPTEQVEPDLTQDNMIIKKNELIIRDGSTDISIKIVGSEVHINTTGNVVINGSSKQVARVGDPVSTSGGSGTITSSTSTLYA